MIVLALGTSGPNPKKHSLIDLGAMDTTRITHGEPLPFFYNECIVWPGADTNEDFLKKNGFTESEVQSTNEIIHETLIYSFANWAKRSDDLTLIVEDTFPITSFLRESFSTHMRNGSAREVPYPFGDKTIDLHSIAAASHRERGIKIPLEQKRSNLTLDRILEYVSTSSLGNSEDEEERKHSKYLHVPNPCDAFTKTLLIAESFWRLVYKKSLFANRSDWEEVLPDGFPEKKRKNIPNFTSYPVSQYLLDLKHR
jgi:hypothetical protein